MNKFKLLKNESFIYGVAICLIGMCLLMASCSEDDADRVVVMDISSELMTESFTQDLSQEVMQQMHQHKIKRFTNYCNKQMQLQLVSSQMQLIPKRKVWTLF